MGLGTNLGSEDTLASARQALSESPGLTLCAESGLYATEPQGYKDQPWYVNQVVALECDPSVTPDSLLETLLSIETAMGRRRDWQDAEGGADDPALRFAPRIIDLDLLLFADVEMESDRLTIPHPRMRERAFVLVPLADIAPSMVFSDGVTLQQAVRALDCRVEDGRIWQ